MHAIQVVKTRMITLKDCYLTTLLIATVSYFFTIFSASMVVRVIIEGFSE